jgi:HTH-type transcriptional regulator/antitoxin HigA
MVQVKPIKMEADRQAALARIDVLMDVEDRPVVDSDELAVLAELVEVYERKHFPIALPTPVEAIRFRMEQMGLEPRDLAPHIGSRGKVSEVLSGKRPLSLAMIRALHKNLGIPADVLLQEQSGELEPSAIYDDASQVEWGRFPLVEMGKLGWFEAVGAVHDKAEEICRNLVMAAGGMRAVPVPLWRRGDRRSPNAKADPYALFAWTMRVLGNARAHSLAVTYRPGTATKEFLVGIARLSAREDGPIVAKQELARHGIHLLFLPHLRRTYLDGAAMMVADANAPVVALTLRHDRLDNFWFCLLHELAHVGQHLHAASDAFLDDMDLRDTPARNEDEREQQADLAAEEALIPRAEWETAKLTQMPSYARISAFAQKLGVHQAIVAGRIRYETKDYRKFAPLLGTGEVSRLIAERAKE